MEGLVEEIKFSFGQLLFHLISFLKQLFNHDFDLLIEPFIKMLGSEQLLTVLIIQLVLLIDEAIRDETILTAGLMDVLFEEYHVVEIILDEILLLVLVCITVLVYVALEDRFCNL